MITNNGYGDDGDDEWIQVSNDEFHSSFDQLKRHT